jgi:hypothetical protein
VTSSRGEEKEENQRAQFSVISDMLSRTKYALNGNLCINKRARFSPISTVEPETGIESASSSHISRYPLS